MEDTLSSTEALAALPQPFDDPPAEEVISLPKPRPLRPTIFPLHPILSKSSSGSPLTSPRMSRRSSSAGSCTSSKSVHFPGSDHQLSSYQFTHSRDQYDRSPIIPSCEDLEIPSCKKSGSGGWMRCLQRKAKEASEAGQPPPFISSVFSGGDLSHPSSTVTSPTEMTPHELPGLMHDDYSSSSESDDHLSPTSYTPPQACIDVCAISSSQLSSALLSQTMLTATHSFCWDSVRSESEMYEDDVDGDRGTIRSRRMSSGDESEHDLVDDDDEEQPEDDDEYADEEEGRLGLCGLGKFSRSSLYAEDDLLGGF